MMSAGPSLEWCIEEFYPSELSQHLWTRLLDHYERLFIEMYPNAPLPSREHR